MKRLGGVAIGCVLWATACQDAADRVAHENVDDPVGQLAVTADTSRPFRNVEDPAPITPVQTSPLTVTGQLPRSGGVGPAGAAGEVTLTEDGQATRLLLNLRGFPVGTEARVSFVRGGCSEPGQVVHTVAEVVRVEGTGFGLLETQVPVPIRSILDGQHSIHVTPPAAAADQAGATLACATLPMTGA
jgi:hypothetical protein